MTDELGSPPAASRPARAAARRCAVAAVVLLAGHLALRNHAAFGLNEAFEALDQGYFLSGIWRVCEGGVAPYAAHARFPYGPYWLLYYGAALQWLGPSIGSIRWAIALLAWVRSVTTYALTARFAGWRWGAVAAAAAFVSPAITNPIPWSGHISSALYVVLAAAVVWAARDGLRPRRWFAVGLAVGALVSTRSFSGLAGLAAAALAGGAVGHLHPPGRHGHWLGTAVMPLALAVAVAALVLPRGPAFWIAFGLPTLACALLAGTESRRRAGTGPATWRAWGRTVGWSLAGVAVTVGPWIAAWAPGRGAIALLDDVYLGIFREHAAGSMYKIASVAQAGNVVPPLPTLPIAAVLALIVFVAAWGSLSRGSAPGALVPAVLVAGTLVLLVTFLWSGARGAWYYGRVAQLWLAVFGFTAWVAARVLRRAAPLPAAVVALACVAGVVWLEAAPSSDWIHENWALGPGIVLAAVGAHALWRRPAPRPRAWRPALACAAALAVASFAFPAVRLWYRLPPGTWHLAPRTLTWLALDRGRVWDDAASAAELEANVAFLHAMVPPGTPLFEFPTSLNRFLGGYPTIGKEVYFMPGLSTEDVDGLFAGLLREAPPPVAVARLDPQARHLSPGKLGAAFPQITQTLETRFRRVQRHGVTQFYVPAPPAGTGPGARERGSQPPVQ